MWEIVFSVITFPGNWNRCVEVLYVCLSMLINKVDSFAMLTSFFERKLILIIDMSLILQYMCCTSFDELNLAVFCFYIILCMDLSCLLIPFFIPCLKHVSTFFVWDLVQFAQSLKEILATSQHRSKRFYR